MREQLAAAVTADVAPSERRRTARSAVVPTPVAWPGIGEVSSSVTAHGRMRARNSSKSKIESNLSGVRYADDLDACRERRGCARGSLSRRGSTSVALAEQLASRSCATFISMLLRPPPSVCEVARHSPPSPCNDPGSDCSSLAAPGGIGLTVLTEDSFGTCSRCSSWPSTSTLCRDDSVADAPLHATDLRPETPRPWTTAQQGSFRPQVALTLTSRRAASLHARGNLLLMSWTPPPSSLRWKRVR